MDYHNSRSERGGLQVADKENDMKGYIDIHSHILPAIDDGAENMEQTIRMIKIAYQEGIRTIIATPHYYQGRSMTSKQSMVDSLNQVKAFILASKEEETKENLLTMKLELGCEIYYSHDCVNLLKEGQIPTLAGSRYVLVEFSPLVEGRYMKNALQEFLLEGYQPIIAHIERYQNVAKDMDKIEEFIEMGAYVQVNAMSITGEAGRSYQKATKKLLKQHWVHMIGTDAHSDGGRAPMIQKCAGYIKMKYGEEYAQELLIDNPKKILNNECI